MEQLLVDYEGMKERHHIVEAVAEFHLRFEGVHPFIDGNGRTGRLILNLELIKAGLLPVNIKFADRLAREEVCSMALPGPNRRGRTQERGPGTHPRPLCCLFGEHLGCHP